MQKIKHLCFKNEAEVFYYAFRRFMKRNMDALFMLVMIYFSFYPMAVFSRTHKVSSC